MEDGARLSVGGMFALIGAEVERGVEELPFPAHVSTDSRDVERRSCSWGGGCPPPRPF